MKEPPTLDTLDHWLTHARQACPPGVTSYTSWQRTHVPHYTEEEYEDISEQLIKNPSLTRLQWCAWLIHGIPWVRHDDIAGLIRIEPYVKAWILASHAKKWLGNALKDIAARQLQPEWPQTIQIKSLWVLENLYVKNEKPYSMDYIDTNLTRMAFLKHLDDTFENMRFKGEVLRRCVGIGVNVEQLLESTYSDDLKWAFWMANCKVAAYLPEKYDDALGQKTLQSKIENIYHRLTQESKEWWRQEGSKEWSIQHHLWDADPLQRRGTLL